jgi:hypothetical protein
VVSPQAEGESSVVGAASHDIDDDDDNDIDNINNDNNTI